MAAKHGVVGIAKTLANELARHKIRVNTVHPTGVNTPMGDGLGGLNPLIERDPNLGPIFMNTLPVEMRRAARHQQRRAVPGLGRGPVRDRPGVHRRRREHHSMSESRDGREPLTASGTGSRPASSAASASWTWCSRPSRPGRDILLEGPPGTSKSTLLRAITAEWGIPLVFVEGNADLTPAKLVGHHNPARVLREDYSPDNFVDGPLVEAMRDGGFLYIEEFNRAPEDTLNTLLTAMAERRIAVPRVGEVIAGDTFRVIASMNPYDNIGTTRLSTSVHDRLCRLAVTYQDAAAERGIVALRAPRVELTQPDLKPAAYERLVADAVAVTRATREHEDIRQGSSVRGAIDLTLVAGQLFQLGAERGVPPQFARDTAATGSSAGAATGPGTDDERLPGDRLRRDGGRAVRPDLPRRDGRGHARAGAAADLGGPLHPRARRGRARLKSGGRRLPAAAPGRARPAARPRHGPLRPLRRKPKTLTEEPGPARRPPPGAPEAGGC